jgi:hypothetical protein
MDKTVMRKLSELVLDYDLYPRHEVNSQHVAELVEVEKAGVTLPPIRIDKVSKRVTDGFHRIHKQRRLHGDDAEIECIEIAYKNEGEMFADAMRSNAGHGRRLSKQDRARCTLLAKKYKLGITAIAAALSMTPAAVKELGTGRIAHTKATTPTGHDVPLKRTVKHLAGKELTAAQVAANDKLSGMDQTFYARQLLTLIQADMLDREDERLMGVLAELRDALDTVVSASAPVA